MAKLASNDQNRKMDSEITSLTAVLDADLGQLINMLTWAEFDSPETHLYALCLWAYGKNESWDVVYDHSVLLQPRKFSEGELISQLCHLRRDIRKHDVQKKTIEWISQWENSSEIWTAESQFVCGIAFVQIGDFESAAIAFQKSAQLFEKLRIYSRSLSAMLNHVAMRTNINPNTNCVAEFLHILSMAGKTEDTLNASVAHMNLSREYQRAGELAFALEHAEEAVEGLKKAHPGSQNHYLAALQLAHVCVESQRLDKARELISFCRLSELEEVQQAVQVLRCLIGDTSIAQEEIDVSSLNSTWRERWNAYKDSFVSLSPKESHLLELLHSGEKSKFQLIENLYGECKDILVAENRFKVLLSRLRKRVPFSVEFNNGLYSAPPRSIEQILRKSPDEINSI